ncbi:serine/threonine-protein phosphatase 7 long form-like protein [Gossypium australe]|uniref:Serine/threonine-protein phosphatase 7 long form-like protein n=1 Tax=Gossypium australe TaxID=47621 RepID=A0A5B6X4M4_9ROSI|nr:serine/threonine-protein phosphatase 7 long form-like protein [Gossypium australe]
MVTPTTAALNPQPPSTIAAFHLQPPPSAADHTMDRNPNVLLNDNDHIASNVHKDLYRTVRPRLHDPSYFPDRRVISYLNVAGFGVAAYIQISELRADLISALDERWRSETHTFHLPCGEVNITLQDVAVQLGLSIDGEAVTGLGKVPDPWATCERLLGRVPLNNEEGRLTHIKFNWLKENFQHLPSSPTQMDIISAARAFILQLIGGGYFCQTSIKIESQ